jgi:hypothetical protein
MATHRGFIHTEEFLLCGRLLEQGVQLRQEGGLLVWCGLQMPVAQPTQTKLQLMFTKR